MDNRLLSEQEIELITRTAGSGYRAWTDIAKAQLAKTDEEWVEWIDKIRPHMGCGGKEHIAILLSEWRERKRSIGISLLQPPIKAKQPNIGIPYKNSLPNAIKD